MRSTAYAAMMFVLVAGVAEARSLRLGAWNIANLHHEEGVPLRPGAEARDAEDFQRLRDYATWLNLDVIALQEIGSPRALERIVDPAQYHLVMSSAYKAGDENRPAEERDIFTAFAVRKSTFPAAPKIESLPALGIAHIGFDRDGTPSIRPTRDGMILSLQIGGRSTKILNVHLKSACHANSLDPVFDQRQDGHLNATRFDCRTLVAQAMVLENWIEQQTQIGQSIIVVGDFNRQFNRLGAPEKDHFWGFINDGTPGGLELRKGPEGKNTTCWPHPHALFHEEHIEFIVFDHSLDSWIKPAAVEKIALLHQTDAKYAGKHGEKLSDHCPIVVQVSD